MDYQFNKLADKRFGECFRLVCATRNLSNDDLISAAKVAGITAGHQDIYDIYDGNLENHGQLVETLLKVLSADRVSILREARGILYKAEKNPEILSLPSPHPQNITAAIKFLSDKQFDERIKLSKKSGVSPSQISRMFNGTRPVSEENMRKIAIGLGMPEKESDSYLWIMEQAHAQGFRPTHLDR